MWEAGGLCMAVPPVAKEKYISCILALAIGTTGRGPCPHAPSVCLPSGVSSKGWDGFPFCGGLAHGLSWAKS